jgi:hypothetical protein
MATERKLEKVHTQLIEQFVATANDALKKRHPELVASAIIVAAAHVAVHCRATVQSRPTRPHVPGAEDTEALVGAFRDRVDQYVRRAYKGQNA